MSKNWEECFDNIDWEAVEADAAKSLEEDAALDALYDHFNDDSFDYKRSYLRKFMRTHPEIRDQFIIDTATEQMLISHEDGVELDVDDALRFAKGSKPMTTEEIVKMLADAGIADKEFGDVLDTMLFDDIFDDGKRGSVKSDAAKKKAGWLTSYAYILERNPDVLILGLPTFDHHSDWTQVRLAFFGESFSGGEKMVLQKMRGIADKSWVEVVSGMAVAVFQIYNIWEDFG